MLFGPYKDFWWYSKSTVLLQALPGVLLNMPSSCQQGAGTMPALAARVQTNVLQKAALLEQPLLECHRAS